MKEHPKAEIKNSEVRLHIGNVLGTPQCLSNRLDPRFDFNFKNHHLKNKFQYLAFGVK